MSRLVTLARAATVLVSVVAATACGSSQSTGDDKTPVIDVQAPGLRDAVSSYYTAVFDKDYERVFGLRSPVCTKGTTAAQFGDDLRSLLSGYDGRPSVTAVRLVARAPGSAVIESTLSDDKAPSFLAGPRKWTRIEGQWRFDNCV